MRCDDVRTILAEFLSGEMSTTNAAAIHQHLLNCAACDQEVRGLREAIGGVQAGAVSSQIAQHRASQITLEFTGDSREIRKPYAQMAPLLRYAAVVAISFGAGYLLRPAAVSGKAREIESNDAGPVIAQRYEAANRAYPKAAGMSKSLLALANGQLTRQ